MSSVPPNMPPNVPPGGPYPPYDSKAQWRAYREQQKAHWRSQRDAWKIQKEAWKAQYGYCPRVPSVVGPVLLIGIGVVAMLITTGHLNGEQFWQWYSHWWPVLMIAAGLGMLGEWFLDARRQVPVRRSGSFIGIVILLAILGMGATGWNHMRGPWNSWFGDGDGDFFNAFGLPEHDNDHAVYNGQIPANASIDIQNPRGDISITASDGQVLTVNSHEVAFAKQDTDAAKIFESETATVRVSGSSVQIRSNGNNSGRVDLSISLPRNAHLNINAAHGDVTTVGAGAGISVDAGHGDVHLSEITGLAKVHLSSRSDDFTAHQIQGNLTLDGECNDLTLGEITGSVSQTGDIMGDVHMENISGSLHLHTSVTDLQLQQLTGDMSLNTDELKIHEARGPVRLTTHSKDIDLTGIAGETWVESRDGRIAVETAGNYPIVVKNTRGDVEVTLPENASASIGATVRNGEILSDFNAPSAGEGTTKSITFPVGGGKVQVQLSTENGDVRIKRGTSATPEPAQTPENGNVRMKRGSNATPEPAQTPKTPQDAQKPVNGKTDSLHLKSSKKLPEHPTAQ